MTATPQTTGRRFSGWQLTRMRDALRAFRHYGSINPESGSFTWKDVREAIALHTGVEIGGTDRNGPRKGAERLRQFVEGFNNPKNPAKRRLAVPQAETLNAIYDFVTHPDVKLLAKEELDEFEPALQAPKRLLEYLDYTAGAVRHIPEGKIEGHYRYTVTQGKKTVDRTIEFSNPSGDGLIQVTEFETTYIETDDKKSKPTPDGAIELPPPKQPSGRTEYRGWAIFTPEDNLFLFLKRRRNGDNRYYFTLGTDFARWNDLPAKQITMLFHDFPIEKEEDDTDDAFNEKVLSDSVGKIFVFERAKGKVVEHRT